LLQYAPLSLSPDISILRWKSQRIKIQRLGYRFSIDFFIHTLGYDFLFANHKHLAKVLRLLVCGFSYWDFKIQILCIFGYFECVSSMFCTKLLLILTFTNAVLSKMTFRSIFVSYDGDLCAKEIHRLGPMDLKIFSLERNPRL
jgi:hypothetical protein